MDNSSVTDIKKEVHKSLSVIVYDGLADGKTSLLDAQLRVTKTYDNNYEFFLISHHLDPADIGRRRSKG
jgi:hypothetical protein